MHDLALELVRQGRSLIPIASGAKVPPKGFPLKEYLDGRRVSEQEILTCLQLGQNLAILTGKVSGIVGFDCDDRPSISYVEKRFNPNPVIGTLTPKGGMHFLFQYPGKTVTNKARLFDQRVDFRGDGGYLMLPGSVVNGIEYIQIGDWTKPAPVFDPSWIESRRTPIVPIQNSAHAAANGVVKNPRAYLRAIPSVEHNNGSGGLMRVCYKLIEWGYSFESALAELIVWNHSGAAKPPWDDEKDLPRALTNAFKKKGLL